MTGDCDCCGNYSTTLRRVWYLGYMETFACAKCRGDDDEEEVAEGNPEAPREPNKCSPDYAMNDYEIRKYTGVG